MSKLNSTKAAAGSMQVIDTSLIMDRVAEKKDIEEAAILISLIEYPTLLEYEGFHGRIFDPDLSDLKFAYELQKKLAVRGRMKPAADLIIAPTCIHLDATLLTLDSDFEDIAKVSDLKLVVK